MGYDYALVHATYTVPPAILLAVIYAPLCTKLDLYKIGFLITIAVAATTPWDSYLICSSIWSYPPNVVLGPTIFSIPLEEVFFFVIQTFNTTLLYLILSKPILHPKYLVKEGNFGGFWQCVKAGPQLVLALVCTRALGWVKAGEDKTYLGLILLWAGPFIFLLWTLAYQLLVRLPLTSTVVPIVLPTLYLWVVDTLALRRGTWVIESGTKLGLFLWPGLEMEEAVFFLLTNTLIVFGLVAFDHAVAVLDAFPIHFPEVPELPSPLLLIKALVLPAKVYDDDRILGLEQAVGRLKAKSRSFYLASGTFERRLRIDLILLYSFCRVADDLIDNAATVTEAKQWLHRLRAYLDISYGKPIVNSDGIAVEPRNPNRGAATLFITQKFPDDCQLALFLLPTQRLSREPLYDMLKGFEMDLEFGDKSGNGPVKTQEDLDLYGARVAGTVASLCIELVLFHYPGASSEKVERLLSAGRDMGVALQYTNIARDLSVDAALKRCYIPQGWLKKEKLTTENFIAGLNSTMPEDFFMKKVVTIRERLLERAFGYYGTSVDAIEELPAPARAPMRVAVESYMQIARELKKPGYQFRLGRATVPLWKRIWVAWRVMLGRR